jgi:hypothetical protein
MPSLRTLFKFLHRAAVVVVLLAAGYETVLQEQDRRYVAAVARQVVTEARAASPRERVLALRDHLRAHVTFHGAAHGDSERPFLRSSAGETLRTGKGYCGEVTRAFICMADTVGIRAQRINLYGRLKHVVAEAELGPNERLIVDCQNPPQVAGLEPLDRVILRPDYDDYYTLNLRRLHLSGVVRRVKLAMGPLTYWTENPHALKAGFWALLALLLVAPGLIARLVRLYLRKRGWIHRSDVPALRAALAAAGSPGPPPPGSGETAGPAPAVEKAIA